MIGNYLKTALRNLRRHKVYTLINISGLAVGMALCLLIYLLVRHELSYDRYHENSDRIFRLAMRIDNSTLEHGVAKVADLWGPGGKAAIPEIKDATRFVIMGRALVSRGDRRQYEANGFFADSSTFEIFSWPLLRGDPSTALVGPDKIVLTESFAERWFGGEDPLGQTLRFDSEDVYTVSGVMHDVPANSHFTFDFLVSLESYEHPNRGDWFSWNQFYTYLLLTPGASPDVVSQKFDRLLDRHLEPEQAEGYEPIVQPLTSIHLGSRMHREIEANSDVAYVYIFSTIALFILLIACTNFVSLATARSSQRAREVGIRKASGADKRTLIRQFLGESILLSALAAAAAFGIAALLMDPFNQLSGKSLELDLIAEPMLLVSVFVAAVVVGVLAGLYPAFVLSAFEPSSILKGETGGSARGGLRRALVVFQFAVSSFLIIVTGVVYSQLDFITNKNLGFSKEQIVLVPAIMPETNDRFETVKARLLAHPGVRSVSFTGNRPGGSDWGLPIQIEGLDQENTDFSGFRVLNVDWDFLDTYQVELAAGRGFSRAFPADTTTWLINETAARELGWTMETVKRIGAPRVDRPFAEVIGIVKDFHFRSMHEEIAPLLIMMHRPWLSTFNIKLAVGGIDETLAHIESVMAEWDAPYPFTYQFFDEQFDSLHRAEERTASLLTYFAILAIFIACLGLVGLTSHTATQRTKEIGVRKVLGATASRIVLMLTSDIARLVIIAFVIASPLAWYAMSKWMENFAYDAGIGWSVFAVSAAVTLAIALMTVSYHSLRAALTDPVKALRYE